jgi:TolA-binding protein
LIGIGVVVASSAAAAALGELPDWLAWGAPAKTSAPSLAPAATTEKQPRKASTPRATSQPPAASPGDSSPSAPPPAAIARPAAASTPAEPAEPAALVASKRAARPPASEAPALDSPPAADLLGAANRARAERNYAAALATYRDVIERYPQTRQAQIAAVAAGELELERGNARAAEPLFQRVPHDAEVGAEALFGLSEAYRARERVVEERSALERFVQLYPSNPLAAAARQRLSRLEAAMKARAPR